MSDPLLVCRELTKSYRKNAVLRELSLSLDPGATVGLLGKNGSGKTTLIKCALGLVRPDSGTAEVFGESAWSLSAAAKARLGYVPQIIQLYPWLKVRQTIDYIASFYPRWNDALIGELLARWELPQDDRVGPLSVGQLQKLGILLALGHEPDLLVLDEPAAALDPLARREFLSALLEIAADARRTILFSTHITADLERVASHVAILKDGTIAWFGPLDALKDRVKRLLITAPRPFARTFSVPGALAQQISGNQARISILDATPDHLDSLRHELDAQIEVEDLNLDDIFLEFHHA